MLTMAELQQVISYMQQLQDALANRVDVTSLPDTLQYLQLSAAGESRLFRWTAAARRDMLSIKVR